MKRPLAGLLLLTAVLLWTRRALVPTPDWVTPLAESPRVEAPSDAPIRVTQLKPVPGTPVLVSAPVDAAARPAPKPYSPPLLHLPVEETTGLDLSEEAIQRMEEESLDLRSFAKATPTYEGWYIHLTPEDRVFARAGIRSGDLITQESLHAQLDIPERAALAKRFSAILKAIESD